MTLDKIVIVGNRTELHESIRTYTKQLFSADDIQEAVAVIDRAEPDLVICDNSIENSDVIYFLREISQQNNCSPVIVLSEHKQDWETYKNSGAADCLCPATDFDRLKDIVHKIINPCQEQDWTNLSKYFLDNLPPEVGIAGKSPSTRRAIKLIEIIAQSRCNPVLIIGETGTGKELAARAIHNIRHSRNSQFVAVNCAALTSNLLESELFGHEKGSFTGADKEKMGLFELAKGGTIFLDEISEMPLELQSKLLRVIQEKTFRKVGGIKDIHTDATIIASSNRNLAAEAKNRKFRQDLYYRLAVCPITLAPLKSPDRKEDITLLAEYFLQISDICPEKRGKIKGFTKLASDALKKHDWPGNVREVKNVIDRAILLETTDKIGLTNLMLDPDEMMATPTESAASSLQDYSLEKAEKELISRALNETNWQKTRAASLLGITRATLYAKVKQYNISQLSQPQSKVCV